MKEARRAADAVKIEYKDEKKPVLKIKDAVKDAENVSNDVALTGPTITIGDHDIFDLEKGRFTNISDKLFI